MNLICTIIFYLTILLSEATYVCKSCVLIGSWMYGSFVWWLWVLCLSYKSFRISPCQNYINISIMHTDCILWYIWNLLWYGMRLDPSSLHPTPIQWQSDTICWITCRFSQVFWDQYLFNFSYRFSQFSSIKCIHIVEQLSLLSLKLFHHFQVNFMPIMSSNASFPTIIPPSVASILLSVSMNFACVFLCLG